MGSPEVDGPDLGRRCVLLVDNPGMHRALLDALPDAAAIGAAPAWMSSARRRGPWRSVAPPWRVEAVRAALQDLGRHVLVPSAARSVHFAATHARELGLRVPPVPEPGLHARLHDKQALDGVLQEVGLARIETHPLSASDPLPPGGPWLVKPAMAGGSYGQRRLDDDDAWRRHAAATPVPHGRWVAQRHKRGTGLDVSLFAWEGEVRLLACHRRQGRDIVLLENEAAISAATTLVEATGYHGLMNVDIVVDDDVFIHDVNCRVWSSHDALRLAGMDFVGPWVRSAIDGAPPPRRRLTWGRVPFASRLRNALSDPVLQIQKRIRPARADPAADEVPLEALGPAAP